MNEIMRLLILITINLTSRVFSRKYLSSSDETIENLLYYKGCNHKTEAPVSRIPLREPVRPPPTTPSACPYPRMCCMMTCDKDQPCATQPNPYGYPMQPSRSNMQQPIQPILPPQRPPLNSVQPIQRGRKRRIKPLLPGKIPPFGGRRGFSFTKDKIKNLISHDNDIRKILKDLVRVTMQKVDLQDMINTRRNNDQDVPEEVEESSGDDESDTEFLEQTES